MGIFYRPETLLHVRNLEGQQVHLTARNPAVMSGIYRDNRSIYRPETLLYVRNLQGQQVHLMITNPAVCPEFSGTTGPFNDQKPCYMSGI